MWNYVIRTILGILGRKHVWNSCYLGCSSKHNLKHAKPQWGDLRTAFSNCCCWDPVKIGQSLNEPYVCICSGTAVQTKSTTLGRKLTTFILNDGQFYLWSLFKMEKLSPALKPLALANCFGHGTEGSRRRDWIFSLINLSFVKLASSCGQVQASFSMPAWPRISLPVSTLGPCHSVGTFQPDSSEKPP